MHKFQIFVVILFFGFAHTIQGELNAQQSEPSTTSIGIKAGIGATSHLHSFRFMSGDIDLDFTPNFTTGFDIGVIARRNLTNRFRIQLEPSIVRFGASYQEGFQLRGFNFQTDSRSELLYFQLPVLFQISSTPPERRVYGRQYNETTFHVNGGIYGGYLLDAKFSGTNSGAPVGIEFSGSFSNDVRDQYKDMDAGLLLGVGVEHGYSSKTGVDLRAQFSVIDSGNTEEFSFRPQNMSVSLVAYFLF